MKIIGEASEEDSTSNLTLLGITSRDRVYGTYPELATFTDPVATEHNKKSLNQQHSSFLFVKNKMNDFRTRLEKYLKETFKIPFFVLALNSGFDTIETILNSLNQSFPIVLVAVNLFFKSK